MTPKIKPGITAEQACKLYKRRMPPSMQLALAIYVGLHSTDELVRFLAAMVLDLIPRRLYLEVCAECILLGLAPPLREVKREVQRIAAPSMVKLTRALAKVTLQVPPTSTLQQSVTEARSTCCQRLHAISPAARHKTRSWLRSWTGASSSGR